MADPILPVSPHRSNTDFFSDPLDSHPLWFKPSLFLSSDFDSEASFFILKCNPHQHQSSVMDGGADLETFQTHVTNCFQHFSAPSQDLFSLSWLRDLLDGFLRVHHQFKTLILSTPKSQLSKPTVDRLLSDYFERSIKALDVCNARRDGIEQMCQWHKLSCFTVDASLSDLSSLSQSIARMVLHHEIQSKAQREIDSVIGSSMPVSGFDIPILPYLQAIVKESFRVHPPGPQLLWARIAIHDVYVGDSFVLAGTTAMSLVYFLW